MLSPLPSCLRQALPLATLLALLLSSLPAGSRSGADITSPEWFREHLESRMANGGRWVASNQAYLSDIEPIDAYGIEWEWGVGKRSIRGRVFAIAEGRETATVYELRTLWHPGENRALVYQYGADGSFGAGTLEPDGEGGTRLEQTIQSLDGEVVTMRHTERGDPDGTHISSSRTRTPDGWTAGRVYVWVPRAE